MEEANISKKDILKYGYYNDYNEYIVILDENKLKEIFKADKVLFQEED